MLNGVTLSSVVVSMSAKKFLDELSFGIDLFLQKQYVAKSKRSTINFTINGEGNMDITHLVVKGKNILLVRRGTKETEVIYRIVNPPFPYSLIAGPNSHSIRCRI
jgi:hypothetical protein